MAGNFAEDYVDVSTRIRIFKEKHPEGSLQPVRPIEVVEVGDKTFLSYVAAAYRTPTDERPGIGTAWEPFPGKTPYTRDSEAMVAETSAWGRAIVASLAADTKKGIASAEEVRNRNVEPEAPTDEELARGELLEWLKSVDIHPTEAAKRFDARQGYDIRAAKGSVIRSFMSGWQTELEVSA